MLIILHALLIILSMYKLWGNRIYDKNYIGIA